MVDELKLPADQMIFSVEDLKKAGYSHYKINQLVADGTLLKLNKKYYENAKYHGEESDFYYVQAYAPQGVVCLMSAASYYNLTTFRTDSVDVAIQRKAKISTMPDWPVLSVYYYADDRFKTGIETVREGQNQFKIYDIEKTVVDIVCFREKVGIEETKEILVNYLRRKDRDLNRLLRYAEMLKMWKGYENISGGTCMISAISVKDRLKNQAKKHGRTMQDELVTYGLERAIYRLSISEYAERFTLKGGIFLYALFDGNFARATMDIDLLAQHISNDAEEMKNVFYHVFSIECDDALRFDLKSLDVINITEFKEYHGVNVSVMGYLDRTRVPISIDIGFGDVIYPERMRMTFPVLLDMDAPEVYAYSIYSVISEKFEAFVSLGLANGRYKDFYDIYVLSAKYDLNGDELKNAIVETFTHRETTFDDIAAFDPDFTEDTVRQRRWDLFIKKKKAMMKIGFKEAIERSEKLLLPIVEAIGQNREFHYQWDKDRKEWI